MEFLYFLENIRNGFLDAVMLILTHLGEETVFMAVAMFFLWCVDKFKGYYLLTVGFLGTQINQLLKVTFRVPRPWVKDPAFEPVGNAIKEATGYSFPSGHTQSAVGTFGGIARWTRRKWLRWICIAVCVVVPFTRMYLGVHTPADVLVSVGIALVLIFGLYPLVHKANEHPMGMRILLIALLVWSVGQVLFMELFPFPSDALSEELYSGLKNAYKMLGAVAGFVVVYELDTRFIRYDTSGSGWIQMLKFFPGLLLSVGVKELLYLIPLPELYNRLVAYFFLVLFAGAVWPLSFKYIRKLEQKK
ncbi:MAG: phosphatase PAP2 family protein [Clostridia bacterium]|nr:phosphatase PAP2 family protein [Clostridia bacterium]